MKNKPNHVMIDLETMGKKPGCPIVSIGAVVFDPRYGVITKQEFYVELDWMEQKQSAGLTPCMDTMVWWENQSPQARAALDGLDDLKTELKNLSKWLPQDCKVWGNGATFDISILEFCYDAYKLPIPWKFWNIRDCRTVRDMFECTRGGLGFSAGSGRDKKNVAHNALHDARHQAQYINKMWKVLVGEEK